MPYGKLTSELGLQIPVQVLQSAAGYFIGTRDEEGPNRESAEYWPTKAQAETALNEGQWTQY